MTEGAADAAGGGCGYIWARANGDVVGELQFFVTKTTISPEYVFVEPDYRGQGIAMQMYESAYSWAFERGVRMVEGYEASTAAHHVHCAIARKWGTRYSNSLRTGGRAEPFDFDSAYGAYSYDLD